MKGYFVSNWRLLMGSILGFLGALTIAMDKFPPIHNRVDHIQPWSDIAHAMKDLNTYDHHTSDSSMVGYISVGDRGFEYLAEVIRINRTEIPGSIIAIAQNSPMTLGGVPSSIVHVVLQDIPKAMSVTTDFVFREWIAKYRERFFLRWGLSFVTFAFFLGIVGRIDRRK